jgi:NADPH:quinone reductase-like Zn-dependent oxidoreductase
MKAIVQTNYGPPEQVLELKEIEAPVVKENGVLVRVHSASIHSGDYFGVRGSPFVARFSIGFPNPKENYVPGFDVAGYVEAVGSGVTRFKPGDEVFGECGSTCAEYAMGDASKFVLKPSNITFEQAAAVPVSALAALHGLRDAGKVQPGQKVLINGSSGGVGTFAVQIAKAFGAEVTGVCSTRNLELVRSIGADHVIDYTKEDFTQGSQRYDLILDQVANHSLSDCRRVLTPQGKHIPNSGNSGLGYIINAFVSSLFIRQQSAPFLSIPKTEDLETLKEFIETGKVTPVIDRTYPLSEMPQAMSYVGKGHARGKVVISVANNSQ